MENCRVQSPYPLEVPAFNKEERVSQLFIFPGWPVAFNPLRTSTQQRRRPRHQGFDERHIGPQFHRGAVALWGPGDQSQEKNQSAGRWWQRPICDGPNDFLEWEFFENRLPPGGGSRWGERALGEVWGHHASHRRIRLPLHQRSVSGIQSGIFQQLPVNILVFDTFKQSSCDNDNPCGRRRPLSSRRHSNALRLNQNKCRTTEQSDFCCF